MRIRQLLIATASIGFLFDASGAATAAGELPQACVEAGAKTAAECEALLHKAKEPAPAPAEAAKPAPEPKPAEAAPAAAAPAAEPAPAVKPARHAPPPAEPVAAPAAPAAEAPVEPVRKPKPKPAEAAAPAPAEEIAPPAGKPARHAPPAEPVAAPAAPAAEAPAEPAPKPKPKPAVAAAPAPAEEIAPAATDGQPAASTDHRRPKPGTPAEAPVVPAAPAAAAPGAEPRVHGAHLPKDCVAAGIETKAECDALHAKAEGPAPVAPAAATPAPAAAPIAPVAPAAPAATAPAPADAAPAAGEPRVHGQHLPKDCVAAGIQTKAECDALHAKPEGPAPAAPTAVTPAPAPGSAVIPPAHKPPAGAEPVAPAAEAKPTAPATEAATPPAAGAFGLKPPGVPPNLVAPLFDSAKDAETNDGAPAGTPGRPRPQHPRPAVPAGPPPANDQAAQTGIRPPTIQPIDKTQGEQIAPDSNQPIGLQLPPGAQVIQPSADDRFRPGGPGDRRHHQPGGPGTPPGGPDFAGPPPAAAPDPLGLALGAIVQLGGQMIINSPGQDQQRISGGRGDQSNYERLPGNRYRETVTRPNGIRIVTIYDQRGDVLRRSRFDQDGRETVLAYFDARDDQDLSDWRDPGDDLPPLQPDIAPQDYVLDADQASESQVQRFFAQPPVEQVQRLYSIDEVKRSARIRDMVRRLEIGDLTFDTGAATISEDQVQNLDTVAKAILALLQRNPAETFLIEGHTDAVGSEIANLQLSDARAATVAEILTDFYHVPPENLATQGYGERFLIVQTDGPERLNRRVTIRRITPLITVADQPY